MTPDNSAQVGTPLPPPVVAVPLSVPEPGRSWRASLSTEERSVCSSCGADTSSTLCASCGRPLGMGPSVTHNSVLGEMFVYKKRLLKSHVLRIARSGTTTRYLGRNGKSFDAADREMSESIGVAPELARLFSIAGGLVAWIAAMRSQLTDERFPERALADAALEATSADLFQARRLGQDLISLGLHEFVSGLSLPDTERSWLALIGAARWGDAPMALQSLSSLPPGAYRGKVKLIARLWPWFQAMEVTQQLLPHIAPFATDDPLASALVVLLGTRVSSTKGTSLVEAVSARVGLDGPSAARLETSLQRVRAQSTSQPGTRVGRADRSLEALDPAGSAAALTLDDVVPLPQPLKDDLIELGRLASGVTERIADECDRDYLVARMRPDQLSDPAVDRLVFVNERIRRALIRRDSKTVETFLPEPYAAHARSLLSIVHNRPDDVDIDLILPPDRPIIDDLLALYNASANGDGVAALLSDQLTSDVTVWEVIHETIPTDMLRPTPELRTRSPAFVEWLSLVSARELLYRGRWSEAAESARACLELAKDEAVRDEALNLLACGLFQRGEDEAAIAALEKAIDGAYSESLLANIGVVAAGLRPELAATYLGKLANEAPTIDLKLAAVRRIIAMWNESTSWEGTEAASGFPTVVRDPIRGIFTQPIPLDEFRQLARLLSQLDSSWLATVNLQASPHGSTLEARFYVARAKNWGEMITVMASVKATQSAPAWFDKEISEFSSFLIDTIIDDLMNDRVENPGLAQMALSLSDTAERLDGVTDAKLLFGGSALLLDCFWQDKTTAADVMATRLERGRNLMTRLDPAARESLEPLCNLAHTKLAANFIRGSYPPLEALIDQVNQYAAQLRHVPDANTFNRKRAAARRVAEQAAIWRERIARLLPFVHDADAERFMQERIDEIRRTEVEAWGLA